MRRRVTEFLENLFNHLETFYRDSTNDGWMSFWGALIGAVISAGAALWVVDRQYQQQKVRDQEQQTSNEQNKLKYLHFLIEDSFKAVKYYALGVGELRKSLEANPFSIPAFGTYPAHSLYAIANKINQEEYYLASLNLGNQFKSDKIVELLLLCNTLYESHRKASEHFRTEFPKLVDRKDKFRDSLKDLMKNVNKYIIKYERSRQDFHQQVQELQKKVEQINSNTPDRDYQLLMSNENYIIPLIKILEPFENEEERNLLNQARSVNEDYIGCVVHLSNVVKAAETSSNLMNDMARQITDIGRPLNDYVESLKSQKK